MPYIGNSPGTGTRNRYIYTATASQTTFSGADDNGKTLAYSDGDYVDVFLNGICLVPVDDYTATSKTSIVLTVGAAADDILEVVAYDIATIADTVSKANGGTFEGRIAIGGSTTEDPMLYVNTGTSANNFNGVFIENSNDATATAPDLTLYRNSSSPADDDNLGSLWFYGQNDADERTLYAGIHGAIADVTDADEGGRIEFFGMTAGSTETWAVMEEGKVGIGTSSPTGTVDIFTPAGTEAKLVVRNGTSSSPVASIELRRGSTSATFGADAYGDHRLKNEGGNLSFDYGESGTTTERMRIDSDGNLLVGKTSPAIATNGHELNQSSGYAAFTRSGTPVFVGRNSTDGELIVLRQDGSTEGAITVSGSTVSYNGGHLARWSQLADGSKDTSLLKGTVLTNLDQMAVWSHDAVAATYYEEGDELPEGASVGDEKTPAADAYTEDNEQLNCMAVSSVEGDPNVAGVFVNWDHDDDQFNDMNIAMTGDMIIRIAQGTTVQRGDLLMSAGDGTAKPQGDDIVRNKTIAKVTSTHVTCTYDDGSYCVPCVLMAC